MCEVQLSCDGSPSTPTVTLPNGNHSYQPTTTDTALSPLARHFLQSDYAMEIYRSLNNTAEDPPGKRRRERAPQMKALPAYMIVYPAYTLGNFLSFLRFCHVVSVASI